MTEVRLPLTCGPARARTLVAEHLLGAGWRPVGSPSADGAGPEHLASGTSPSGSASPSGASPSAAPQRFERGRLGRSVLLGGLAGASQHLMIEVAVHPAAAGSDAVCSWSDVSPRALGGILGKRRAERRMRETVAGLRAALEHAGVLRLRPPGSA